MNNFEQWQIVVNGSLIGPYTSEQILQFYSTGHINENTFVLKCGTNQAMPLGYTELMQYIQSGYNSQQNVQMNLQSNKPYTTKVSNTLVILYSIFTSIVSVEVILALTEVSHAFSEMFMLGFLLLSVSGILLIADAAHMKKVENKFSAWLLTSFLFPVAYLFIRASRTDKNKFYAILGIINFIITYIILGFYIAYVSIISLLLLAAF